MKKEQEINVVLTDETRTIVNDYLNKMRDRLKDRTVSGTYDPMKRHSSNKHENENP